MVAALDLTDPLTVVVLVAFVLFGVYWWYRWQWRAAWFDRVWIEVASRRGWRSEAEGEESGGDREPAAVDREDADGEGDDERVGDEEVGGDDEVGGDSR